MRKASGRGMALSHWGASESRGQIWPGILLSGRRWGRPEITVRRRAAALQLLQPPPPPHPLPIRLPTSASILDRMKCQWWDFNLRWHTCWFHFTYCIRGGHTLRAIWDICVNMGTFLAWVLSESDTKTLNLCEKNLIATQLKLIKNLVQAGLWKFTCLGDQLAIPRGNGIWNFMTITSLVFSFYYL